MSRFQNAAVAAVCLLIVACDGDAVSPGTTNNPPPPSPQTPAAISTIDLSAASASLAVGQTKTLVATPRDAAGNTLTNRTLTWSTSAASIATVDANGVVAGIAVGTATVSVTAEGKTAAASITVTAVTVPVPVAKVDVGPALDTVEA